MSLRPGERQMSMIVPNVEEFISADHRYRKLLALVDWVELARPLRNLYSPSGRRGYPVEQGLKFLFLQFLEDRSDRQMESYLKENLAAKYFCNLGLRDEVPDHSYFGKFRERIGLYQLAEIFKRITNALKKQGLVREIYTFVDSAKIVACVDTWKARDKAIADLENQERDDDNNPTMNNRNTERYSSDPDARFGVKGKNNIWLGFKRHLAVDASQGLITKVTVTSANVHDGVAFRHIAPSQGAVLADKIFSDGPAKREMLRRGLHSMAIKKNSAKDKNHRLDAFLSSLRMPFEGLFSKMSHRARYRGRLKVHFQALMEAMVSNFKRLIVIGAQPIPIH
jgi:IS5 family transposase